MTMSAVGTVTTETSVIPGTRADLGFWINVKERTLLIVTRICQRNKVFNYVNYVIKIEGIPY